MNQLNPQNFFDNLGGGGGAPGAKLSDVDDYVMGEIVDQFMAPATDFSTKKPKLDKKTGAEIEQLVVIVQTEHRNWDNVNKIPLVDKDDRSSGNRPGEEDDGRRAVYVEPWTNIAYAVRDGLKDAGVQGGLQNGATFGVKVVGFKDTGKGNPAKQHKVVYTPPAAPSASDAFFGGGATQEQAPAQEAPAAAAAPAPQPVQEAPAAAPAAQSDPWGTPAPTSGGKPPF